MKSNSNAGKLSRRRFLQWSGTLGAAAVLSGCSNSDEDEYSPDPYRNNLVFDRAETELMHAHSGHCAGGCMLKLRVKNGRVVRITSAGDISYEKASANATKLFANDPDYGISTGVWAGSEAADESLAPIQKRACIKGLSEIHRIYSPDRLKYPLKQTKERGNRSGFVRIGWDEALNTVAGWVNEMKERKSTLGYMPILDSCSTWGAPAFGMLGNYVTYFGNPSSGGQADAFFASLGPAWYFPTNLAMDMLNSKFIINWANDARSSRNAYPFYMTKAKEAGIPIVVIDPRYTETVATMATGSAADGLPGWISIKPGTDSAMLAAMCYVIYKNDLHDKDFIRDYCFGFNPNDSVISTSFMSHPVTGAPYAGTQFDVPVGQSFVEYLISLENDWGGASGNIWNGTNAAVGDATYKAVLAEAERLTSVSADVIEKLAIKYATTKPSFLNSSYHGGAQRAQNGMFYSWLLVALSAMTGQINKRGGGCGEISAGNGYQIATGAAPASISPAATGSAIFVSNYQMADVILTGRDFRTAAQLRDDVLAATGMDLGADAKVKIEMIYRGSGDSTIFNQTNELTKSIMALGDKNKIKYFVAQELHMSTEASYADIILPAAHNFEMSSLGSISGDCAVHSGPVKPLYETKPDWLIVQELQQKLGFEAERSGGASDEEIMKAQWEGASIPADYLALDTGATVPEYEKIIEEGIYQLSVPLNKMPAGLADTPPGLYMTDTGRINFYSPYLAERGRAAAYRAQHVRQEESYYDIIDNGGKAGAKVVNGQNAKYTLVLITPHVIQRNHSQYDNIAILKDLFPHNVCMHPVDAGKRGINNGDMVYVYNDNGCIKLPVEITKRTHPDVIAIGQGAWYRAGAENYEAWLDTDGDGIAERHTVPVDVGGNVNSLVKGRPTGAKDPFIFAGFAMPTSGNLCEVSKVHPDTI